MSSLFICLYLDEDVNVLVADLLKARGFDVITARDAGKLQATDAEQFAYAVSQARTLVTHNRTDFEELVQAYYASGQMHYGVIFAVRRSPQEIAQRLLVILNQVTADEMQNQVRYTHILHLAVETAATQTKPASAGYKTLDFWLVRAGGLSLYSPRIPF